MNTNVYHHVFGRVNRCPVSVINGCNLRATMCSPTGRSVIVIRSGALPYSHPSMRAHMARLHRTRNCASFIKSGIRCRTSNYVAFPILNATTTVRSGLTFSPSHRGHHTFCSRIGTLFPRCAIFINNSSSFSVTPTPCGGCCTLSGCYHRRNLARSRIICIKSSCNLNNGSRTICMSSFPFLAVSSCAALNSIIGSLLWNQSAPFS